VTSDRRTGVVSRPARATTLPATTNDSAGGEFLAGPETVIAQWREEAHQQPDQEQNNDDQEDHPYGIAPGNSDAGINGRSSTAAKEE